MTGSLFCNTFKWIRSTGSVPKLVCKHPMVLAYVVLLGFQAKAGSPNLSFSLFLFLSFVRPQLPIPQVILWTALPAPQQTLVTLWTLREWRCASILNSLKSPATLYTISLSPTQALQVALVRTYTASPPPIHICLFCYLVLINDFSSDHDGYGAGKTMQEFN